ncbi:PilT/PilU family type 4a pilus ATPase [Aquihabitans sp. G128]|uniref:PilT/PilU family type 4a pilus ATPase n=1 Tax=Aquihabitans sp. G128 TaxID=2849779 RepID=UPI001C238CB6|nr:PilT/PilU family type 4a pilus ATPase [Aquihabitans sp. G128]QXC59561.1 PilT/PilU family type 4a pilus ATPase [Aquihabitans sp. G128]
MLSSQARRFGAALIDRHVLTRDEVEAALDEAARTGSPFPEVLARAVDLHPRDLAAAWAASAGARFIDFTDEVVHPEAPGLLPEPLARSSRAVPLRHAGDAVLVVFQSPLDAAAVQAVAEHLRTTAQLELEVGVAEASGIDAALAAAYGGEEPVAQSGDRGQPSPDLYRLFDRTIELGGSDLHLAAGQPPMVRLVGELMRMPDEPVLSASTVREMVYSILTGRQKERFEETNELDTSHAMGAKVRFRVNVFVQRNAVGAAFRVIPYDVVPFEQLGAPEIIRTWADLPRGLVLVTGPTGSGKSTTLASLIDIVNRSRQSHIITIEDPIEFVHRSQMSLVNQREVGEDTSGFGRALTSAMRQDPDVILVGEMRDLETISTAITAAETGHLVFGTLHTQDAAQTVDRIIDVFPPGQQGQVRIQLANSLVGVSTQQLVPTADGRSRAMACEVLVANTAIRALIRDGKVHQIHNAMASGKRLGMQLMDEALAGLVRSGVVNADQAMRRAHNPDELKRMLAAPGAPPAR